MTSKKESTARDETVIPVSLEWPETIDLPTVYANQLFISHAGREFFLIFGEVTPPVLTKITPERLQELKSIEIKPVAKIAISAEAMPEIAKVIEENVANFLAKRATSQ